MVLRGLNPMLSQLGVGQGIRLDHVLGVSTLLADKHGCLHKDSVLVREDAAYALLDEDVLGSFRLTAHLQFPVPTYSGKIGCVWDVLGRRPYLCVGDSPGDHALLAFSENRLWIARLEKPEYQQKTLELIGQTGPAGWIIQPALCRETPGFVADLNGIRRILPRPSAQVRASVDLLASRTSSLVSSL
jgi:rRNA processing protein Gar1